MTAKFPLGFFVWAPSSFPGRPIVPLVAVGDQANKNTMGSHREGPVRPRRRFLPLFLPTRWGGSFGLLFFLVGFLFGLSFGFVFVLFFALFVYPARVALP